MAGAGWADRGDADTSNASCPAGLTSYEKTYRYCTPRMAGTRGLAVTARVPLLLVLEKRNHEHVACCMSVGGAGMRTRAPGYRMLFLLGFLSCSTIMTGLGLAGTHMLDCRTTQTVATLSRLYRVPFIVPHSCRYVGLVGLAHGCSTESRGIRSAQPLWCMVLMRYVGRKAITCPCCQALLQACAALVPCHTELSILTWCGSCRGCRLAGAALHRRVRMCCTVSPSRIRCHACMVASRACSECRRNHASQLMLHTGTAVSLSFKMMQTTRCIPCADILQWPWARGRCKLGKPPSSSLALKE